MSDMTELFKKAAKKRKEEKKQQEQNGGGFANYDRELPQYTALQSNGFKILRLLGEPISMRTKPTSPKIIYSSFILGDDDKKFRCIFPAKSEQPNWILWKVINKVLSYTWDPNEGENGARVYHNKDSYPTLFQRIAKNNSDNNLETGWRPTPYTVQNVIDRDPNSTKWHKENKKTMLLSKKGGETKSGNMFYEPGYPISLYNLIMEDIIEINGDPNTYDVVIQKLTDKPYYKAFHPVEDYKKIIAKFDGELEELQKAIPGFDKQSAELPLTDEELSWEMYDLDTIFPITSYRKIQNRLGLFLQSVDKAFGTKFTQELESLVEEEKKQWDAEGKTNSTTSTSTTEEKEETKEEDVTEEEPKKKRREKPSGESTEEFDIETIISEHPELKGADHLDDTMKSKIKDVELTSDGKVKTFKYKVDGEDILECINADEGCTMSTPESFTHCPLCGENFE